MDITLERILSLLPRKPDGSFVRGAKKDFAKSIGYDSGDIVSMWISGTSTSYQKKLHEIAAVYHVSVEWLKGETDIKNPPTQEDGGISEMDKTILSIFSAVPEHLQPILLEILRATANTLKESPGLSLEDLKKLK